MKRPAGVLVLALLGIGAFVPLPAAAQEQARPQAQEQRMETGTAAADPRAVESVDAIVASVYAAISGPAGQPRDWDRLRSLFLPGARLVPVQRTPDDVVRYRELTVEEYIDGSAAMLTEIGFTEREIARRVEQFGDVAHVFSTYEGHREGMAEPLVRGVNSIQLIFDGTRWWVASITWSPERPDLPLPPRYRGDDGS